MSELVPNLVKAFVDGTAVSVGIAVTLKLISATAGLFTIVWLGIQIYSACTGVPFHQSKFAKKFLKVK